MKSIDIPLLTIELCFDKAPSELSDFDNVITIRGGDVLWQKERLLSIGAEALSRAGYDRIAWLDADLEFPDPDWDTKVNKALDRWPVVQAFQYVERVVDNVGTIDRSEGAAAMFRRSGQIRWPTVPGLAWAARVSWIKEVGLYDACVIGGGDAAFYVGLFGHLPYDQWYRVFRSQRSLAQMNETWIQHYSRWARKAGKITAGQFGFAETVVRTHYHGKLSNRRYSDRMKLLHDFDPEKHLKRSLTGAWLNRFVPLMTLRKPFAYFHDDDMAPGDKFIEHMVAWANKLSFATLGQEGRKIDSVGHRYLKVKPHVNHPVNVDFVIRGYFVRTADLCRLIQYQWEIGYVNVRHEDILLGRAIKYYTGRDNYLVPKADPSRSMAATELPQPHSLHKQADHVETRLKLFGQLQAWESRHQTAPIASTSNSEDHETRSLNVKSVQVVSLYGNKLPALPLLNRDSTSNAVNGVIRLALTPHPRMTNVGDHAQTIFIRQWLSRYFPQPVVEYDKQQTNRLIDEAQPEDLILLQSGGNMTDHAGISERMRRQILLKCRNNRIIQLQQTIAFSKPPLAYDHPNLMIIARDYFSHSRALRLFPKCDVGICPDFVLSAALPVPNKSSRSGIACVVRRDEESVIRNFDFAKLGDVFDTELLLKYPEEAEFAFDQMVRKIGSYKCVVTDRLHGLIFSVITNTPVVSLPTLNYHKTRGLWPWLRNLPQVAFLDSTTGLEAAIDNVMSATPRRVDFSCHFHQLAARIQSSNCVCHSDQLSVFSVIKQRRTIRRWWPEPIAGRLIKRVIEAGIHAPSAGNTQSIRFMPVVDEVVIKNICQVKKHSVPPANQPPAIIALGVGPTSLPARWSHLQGQDVGAAMQNMQLEAEELGLACCWISLTAEAASHFAQYSESNGLASLRWVAALFLGFPRQPWKAVEFHRGRPISNKVLQNYIIDPSKFVEAD